MTEIPSDLTSDCHDPRPRIDIPLSDLNPHVLLVDPANVELEVAQIMEEIETERVARAGKLDLDEHMEPAGNRHR